MFARALPHARRSLATVTPVELDALLPRLLQQRSEKLAAQRQALLDMKLLRKQHETAAGGRRSAAAAAGAGAGRVAHVWREHPYLRQRSWRFELPSGYLSAAHALGRGAGGGGGAAAKKKGGARSLCTLTAHRAAAAASADAPTASWPLAWLLERAEAGDAAGVLELLGDAQHGLRPDSADSARNGLTPLLLASRQGHGELVAHLLEAGADPNLAQTWRMTPLMYATIFGQQQVVRMLLRAGAELECVDVHGSSALDHAKNEGQDAVAVILEAALRGEMPTDKDQVRHLPLLPAPLHSPSTFGA